MILDFQPWHLDLMKMTRGVAEHADPHILTALAGAGLAYTSATVDGRILAVIGASPRGPGRAEVFVAASLEKDAHPIEFARDVKRALRSARQAFATIEAVAAPGVPARWFKWLGFSDLGGGRWRLS